MGCWSRLPAEIQSIVLEMVANDYRFKSEPYARAGYARVCREWQPVFEQRNFQRLILDQKRIFGLEEFMGKEANRKRRDYLEHLFLRVRLNEYDCTVCQLKENCETIQTNSDIISRAVWNLLIILSKWTRLAGSPGRGSRQEGLTLEFGAYSPSDSKHTFRDFHLEDNYPYQEKIDIDTHFEAYRLRADQLRLDTLNDAHHGWINGHREGVSLESKQRIMGTVTIKSKLPEFYMFSRTFPKVEIVTGFLIRRQFYRKIAAISLRKLLRETFTCLRWFRHEGWHNVDPQQQSRFEQGYKRLLSWDLPTSLRELYIFEDFNGLLHPERFEKRANRSLGRALSNSSRLLEHLSAAFLVNAEDFFANFWPTKSQDSNIVPWQNLRKLALTSPLLHPEIARGKIKRLLVAAGRAAGFMPKLEVMEIWNGGEGHACVVRYSNEAGGPQLSWESTWGMDVHFHHDVIYCWENLPNHKQQAHGNLKIAVSWLPERRKQVKTHATAIRHLKLRRSILDLISDYQLFWEAEVIRRNMLNRSLRQ